MLHYIHLITKGIIVVQSSGGNTKLKRSTCSKSTAETPELGAKCARS